MSVAAVAKTGCESGYPSKSVAGRSTSPRRRPALLVCHFSCSRSHGIVARNCCLKRSYRAKTPELASVSSHARNGVTAPRISLTRLNMSCRTTALSIQADVFTLLPQDYLNSLPFNPVQFAERQINDSTARCADCFQILQQLASISLPVDGSWRDVALPVKGDRCLAGCDRNASARPAVKICQHRERYKGSSPARARCGVPQRLADAELARLSCAISTGFGSAPASGGASCVRRTLARASRTAAVSSISSVNISSISLCSTAPRIALPITVTILAGSASTLSSTRATSTRRSASPSLGRTHRIAGTHPQLLLARLQTPLRFDGFLP